MRRIITVMAAAALMAVMLAAMAAPAFALPTQPPLTAPDFAPLVTQPQVARLQLQQAGPQQQQALRQALANLHATQPQPLHQLAGPQPNNNNPSPNNPSPNNPPNNNNPSPNNPSPNNPSPNPPSLGAGAPTGCVGTVVLSSIGFLCIPDTSPSSP